MQAERLHQDDRHRITRFRAASGLASRRAVVCFEPGRDRMDGFEPTACPRFAARLGIDALTVQTARRDWFLSDRSEALEQALRAATAPYDEITATGFSMGGYGALLYSRAIRARRVLAVSPQYCIDLGVAPWDPARHGKFARIGQPMPRPEDRGDRDLRGVVLYDPTIRADACHAALIQAGFPRLVLVALPHGGHPASSAIGDAKSVGRLSAMLVEDRLAGPVIRQMHRAARRQSASYRLNLARAAAPRHPVQAMAALAQLALDAPPQIRFEAGMALLALDEDGGAVALARLLDDTPDPPPAWQRQLSRALGR